MFIIKKKTPTTSDLASRDNDPKNASKTISSPLEDVKSDSPSQDVDDMHAVATLAQAASQEPPPVAPESQAMSRPAQRAAGDASHAPVESQLPEALTDEDVEALNDLLDRANAYACPEELQQRLLKILDDHIQDNPASATAAPRSKEGD